jgi:hypothetical protein
MASSEILDTPVTILAAVAVEGRRCVQHEHDSEKNSRILVDPFAPQSA